MYNISVWLPHEDGEQWFLLGWYALSDAKRWRTANLHVARMKANLMNRNTPSARYVVQAEYYLKIEGRKYEETRISKHDP
jgi:hypothetical protein